MKNVAILGTGNIGTDLLIKLSKLGYTNLSFVGRREDSPNIQIAQKMGINTSSLGVKYFLENSNFNVVFDCTNALDAKENYDILKNLGIKVIDLTPAKLGDICVPCINGNDLATKDNINMITCGGQASLPLINAISDCTEQINYIEVVSQISSKSAGMSTRINIDNYIETTEYAIKSFSKTKECKVILNINPAEPCVDMQTTVFLEIPNLDKLDFDKIVSNVYTKLKEVKEYVPYYELIIPPMINEQEIMMLSVKVRGTGDFLPQYAGNLDIINCAAIKMLEVL
jgi:acetaldehyde dehydrogenase (acetylating)